MKLLLDEDSQGRAFVRLMRDAGHDVQTVTEAGLSGSPDSGVLDYARKQGRTLLTRNGRDFLALHQGDSSHPGILIEFQDADPGKNMTYGQIVGAIGSIQASGLELAGQCLAVNPWR